ncbi:MAG: manganese efflux pump MntP family protein [Parasphingorhabdus sp.]|uniref:manganese efflux pump MntP n=1 Tax=Parasphingorhabdus sp. TaxID=2709688 RepID=UPI00300163B6
MENLVVILLLAIGLAMDAFAVAVAQGAAGHKSTFNAFRTGAAFGGAQLLMPFFGWVLGNSFATQIASFGHWIALILLCGLGLKMFWEARGGAEDGPAINLSGWALTTAAVATSIDALAAGITFPTLNLPVLWTCIIIGAVTAILSVAGVFIGGIASSRVGKFAEIAGGFILIALGIKIFVEHQFFGM